jgi:hypothetical protein
MIRIDVHPAGENPINTTRMVPTQVHVRPTYSSCGQSPYVATFHKLSTDLDRSHCSWEKGLPTQSTACWPTDPRVCTQFLSQANQWSSRIKPIFCRWQATRLTEPISPICDRYVEYLLTGTNPLVLNWHRWMLPYKNLKIATTLSSPFPSECSTGPLIGPAWSPFYLTLNTGSKV